jgi:azurin
MKYLRVWATAAGLALLVWGCGRQESGGAASSGKSSEAPPPGSGRVVEITGNDLMKFSITEIRATPGEALSVTLVNIGTMPKFSMGHNWVLLRDAKQADTFVTEAASAPTTDYIPASRQGDIYAATKLLGPKESDTVTFYAPKQPGRYLFLCSFPGHYQVGMKGELIVE